MRKDYEQRLEDLAENKRQALRQLNTMFEAKLEEKDLMLLEVAYIHLSYVTYSLKKATIIGKCICVHLI